MSRLSNWRMVKALEFNGAFLCTVFLFLCNKLSYKYCFFLTIHNPASILIAGIITGII